MAMDFSANLRAIRAYHDLTLEEVGSRAGLNPAHLSRIEQGHIKPNLSTLEKLATAYGVSPAELLSEGKKVESK